MARIIFMLLGVGLVIGGPLSDGLLLGAERGNGTVSQVSGTGASMQILRGNGNPVVNGMVIVKFRESLEIRGGLSKTGISSLDKLLGEQGVFAIEQAFPLPARLQGDNSRELQRIYYLQFQSGVHPREVALRISRDPNVEYAVPRYVHRISLSTQTSPAGAGGLVTPDDTLFPDMSHLLQVKANTAWNVVKGKMAMLSLQWWMAAPTGGTSTWRRTFGSTRPIRPSTA
ncbi:MAG: hypothetical protein IID15_04425 [Candidatus Marinimicrobia bacterium]|nr:hypothetical protein [Candidatus Neomarinimicrobiota bacterium]